MAAHRTRRWAALAACAGLLAGCQPAQPTATTQPAQPATAPAGQATTAPGELSAEARLALAQLTPAVARPVNPSDVYQVPQRAEKLVADAAAKIASRDYAGAVADLERAIGYEPANPRIRQLLGFAYAGLRDRGRAEENLRKALKAAPDDLESHLLLAQLELAANQDDRAMLSLRTALACSAAEANEPLAGEAMLRLGELLEKKGFYTAAEECYSTLSAWVEQHGQRYAQRAVLRTIVLRPEQLLVRRGTVLLRLGKLQPAVDFLRRAHARDRTDLTTVQVLVQALSAAGQFPEAEKLLAELSSEPMLRRHLPGLIEDAARTSADKHLPGRVWRAAPKRARSDQLLALSLAQSARRLGAPEDAAEILQSVFDEMPEDAGIARELAELFAQVGKPQEALTILTQALAASPSSEPAVRQGLIRLQPSLPKGLESRLADAAARQPADRRFAHHYLAGRLAHLRGQHELASGQYRQAAQAKADFLPAHEALLEAMLDRQQYDQARQQLQEIQKLNLEPHQAHYLRGRVELALGNVPEAVKALEAAHREGDQHLPTLLLLSEAYRRAGREADARLALEAGLRVPGEKTEVYRRLFPLLMKHRLYRRAEALIAELRAEQPDSLEAALMAAELQVVTGDRQKATQAIADLTRRAPDSSEVRLLGLRLELGQTEGVLSKADLQRAADRLHDILRQDPQSTAARRLLGELYLRSAQYTEAAEHFKALYQADPRQTDVARQYIQVLVLAEQYEPARQALEEMLSFAPEDLFVRRALLGVLEKLQQFGPAIARVEGWLKQAAEPEQRDWHRRTLLRLYESAKQYDKALEFLDKWIESPGDEDLLPNLKGNKVLLLVRSERYDQAERYARDWVRQQPEAPVREVLATALVQAKQYDRTLRLLEEWIPGVDRDQADLFRSLKLLALAEAGRFDQLSAFARQWEQADPESMRPRMEWISALIQAKQHDQALRILEQWLVGPPPAPRSQPAPASRPAPQRQIRIDRNGVVPEPAPLDLPEFPPLGGAAPALLADEPTQPASQPAPATRPARRGPRATRPAPRTAPASQPEAAASPAVLRDPNMQEILRQTTVQVLLMKGDYAEALRRAEQELRLDANNPTMLGIKATCLTEQGEPNAALACLRRIQQLLPQDAGARNNLGYQYADLGIELPQAEELIRQALLVRPEVAFIDSMGWVLYKQGRLGQAAATFEGILLRRRDEEEDDKPLPAVIYDHAGDAFWRLGWDQKAIELWQRALDVAKKEEPPNHEVRHVQAVTPGKIQAVRAGRRPNVAPLGEGVKEPQAP